MISRTILDEWRNPSGTITLFDIEGNTGFLGTWLGKPYHGKGYNSAAKEAFLKELFYKRGIESVFMKIRKENMRSLKAAEKLPYVVKANETRKSMYEKINADRNIYDLYEISKDQYTLHLLRNSSSNTDSSHLLEA